MATKQVEARHVENHPSHLHYTASEQRTKIHHERIRTDEGNRQRNATLEEEKDEKEGRQKGSKYSVKENRTNRRATHRNTDREIRPAPSRPKHWRVLLPTPSNKASKMAKGPDKN